MGIGFKIPCVGVQHYMTRGFKIPLIGGFDIPWVGAKYHG
jgi:hypothetical protein